ncbi:MAG: DUF4350 domain-containing protein, partial [Gemmatimonadales bacterium]
ANIDDRRASTTLAGPYGTKGLAQTLRRLGVPVRPWRRPLFDLARDTAPARRAEVYAFFDIWIPPDPELAAVREFVSRGGRVFVAGYTGIERCFGYASRYLGTDRWERLEDPIPVRPPDVTWTLPGTRRVLERLPVESLYVASEDDDHGAGEHCPTLAPLRTRELLTAQDGRPVALALEFRGGGHAVLLADVAFVANRALKETDVGVMVIPWLLAAARGRVVVDEYHHGFGSATSVWSLAGAAMGWLASQPVGWAILQLLGVGLVLLLVAAVRFGPTRPGVERRRRSPLEHLEALAAGLEGAGGTATGVELIMAGLRRRLGRTGHVPKGDGREWLVALELALPEARGRQAARRLKWIVTQPGGDERVLAAAQAVEDVWEQLHQRRPRV